MDAPSISQANRPHTHRAMVNCVKNKPQDRDQMTYILLKGFDCAMEVV